MKKLFRFLKPYLPIALVAIVLLFVQATADLELPNQMSSIVDVGLQNNGIESAVPDYLSENALNFISVFMEEDNAQLVKDSYTQENTKALSDNKKLYPSGVSADKAMFLKSNLSKENILKLESSFGDAAWTFIYFLRDNAEMLGDTGAGSENDSAEEFNISNVNIEKLYESIPVFTQLKDAGQLDDAIKESTETPEMMKSSGSKKFVELFYTELGMDMAKNQQNFILQKGGLMLLISLIGAVVAIVIGYLSSKLTSNVAHDIRNDLFVKIESFSSQEYNKFSSSSFITRIVNDVQQVSMLIGMAIRMLFYSPIIAIGGIYMISKTNTSMIWTIIVPVVLLFVMFGIIAKAGLPKFEAQQKIIDKLNQVSREGLSGLMVVRAFSNNKFEEEKFETVNQESRSVTLFIERLMSVVFPFVNLLLNLTTVLIIWVSADKISNSTLQVGDMIAFTQYAMQILFSFLAIAMIFTFIPRASVSAKRINEVFEIENVIVDPENSKPFDKNKIGYVEFEDVSFGYDGAQEMVLSNISFTVKPGTVTAFIGSTGSGKSTLVSLIPRLYDVTKGNIKVNGVDVRDVTLTDLRANIGYVTQTSVLLSGSIESNIKYGRPEATMKDVEESVKIAQAEDFMEGIGNNYDYRIAQNATNVSGGQKQRLSIARALTKHSPIYVFDDSFSALDFKTDKNLRHALKNYAKNSSVLIVGQRVSSIMDADEIIVLEDGHIVGRGTHQELIKNSDTYLEIARSQLSEEEVQ